MSRSRTGPGQGFNLGVGVIAAVIIVILLGAGCLCSFCGIAAVLVAMAGDDSGGTAGSAGEPRVFAPAGQTNGAGGDANSASVGMDQAVMVGNVRWKVLEAQDVGSTLQSSAGLVEPLTTNGRFIRIRFEIENQGSEALIFSDVNLVDAQGRTFEDSTDALIGFVEDQEQCLFEQINPNISRTCTAIFETPPDAAGLKAHVGDLQPFGTAEAFINLELSPAPAAPASPAEAAPPAEEPAPPPSPGEAEAASPPSPGEAEGGPPDEAGEDETALPPPEEERSPATGEGGTVPVGQDVFIGQTRWQLLEPAQDLGDYLVDEAEELAPLESEESFIQIRFEVENVGLEPVSFQDIIIVDDQGRRFEPSPEAIWFIEEEEQCLAEEIEPGLPQTCTAIYEIPFDAVGLEAEVPDLFSADPGTALLDLGLEESFE